MRILRPYLFMLLCLLLLAGCQRKGIIPCPKPSSKRSIKIGGPNAQGLEAIKVQQDKNGRVKKKRGFGLF
ncbi:hypothetical protein [Pontibacter actiniarum]|uniref:Lipoprotein n=1 Tax=Pontibacter actiniarum TaxID=323450 RepID=A0A1X9YWR4_9BACT|nr:hypothetical protein [Pontibacter actiniarum]ARS37231.1 hypothetical protein CA264_18345 [Pontibacter actiniarum]